MDFEASGEDRFRGFGEVVPDERAARWKLWKVRGVGFRRMARMIDDTGGHVGRLFEMSEAEATRLLASATLPDGLIRRVLAALSEGRPDSEFEAELQALPPDTELYHLGEAGYPRRLLDLEDPPVFLYVRGDARALEFTSTVAVVGSRDVTVPGARLAHQIGAGLAEAGVALVSGGARGTDAAAHAGCLDGGMPTYVILPGGVDRPTPRANARVFERAIEKGALISEYPIGVRPRRYHFHRRNELIAALGDATVVVRAGEASGTMITARAASDIGRPLCAVPGALESPLTTGCHQLLVEGARCVRNARDVLQVVLGDAAPPEPSPGPQPRQLDLSGAATSPPRCTPTASLPRSAGIDLDGDARTLFEQLRELASESAGRAHADDVQRALGWEQGRVKKALLELELLGAVAKVPGANAFRIS